MAQQRFAASDVVTTKLPTAGQLPTLAAPGKCHLPTRLIANRIGETHRQGTRPAPAVALDWYVNPSDCRTSTASSAISGTLDRDHPEPPAEPQGISIRGHETTRLECESERLSELNGVVRDIRDT
jgi:hypothetical protein